MKAVLMSIFAGLSLTACATGPAAYGPAVSGDGLGFSSRPIEQDRFRVSYTGRSAQEAEDYALLRAAEVTLETGYSHFRIINGSFSDNGRRSGISTSIGIGLGSGRGYRRGGFSNVGIGIGLNDVVRALEGDRINNTIEIKLLRGHDGSDDIFDARSVANSIRPAVFQ